MKRIEQVIAWLREARNVTISTGAGMSAESGVETFRDAQSGHWSRFRPEDLATPEAFARDPEFVWSWYRQRRAKLNEVRPHHGYEILADWQERFERVAIITQNVDGLHARAGSRDVIELHGRLDRVRCVDCREETTTLDDLGPTPRCESCGGWLRPGVVWFGERLPHGAFEAAQQATAKCDLFFVIGTSGIVQPAASLAEFARDSGACVVEINPDPTPISELVDIHLPMKCGEALQAVNNFHP